MQTPIRSTIAILELDGTVKQIYCHWNGHIKHNGKILKQYYKTPELVKELISHGDLSVLAPNINPTGEHFFNTPEKGVCIYYGRDLGVSNTEFQIYKDWENFSYNHRKEEYNYLFNEKENIWCVLNDKANIISFLEELDTPNTFEIIKDNPTIKRTYVKILNGEMSYDDFCKVMLTAMSGK